jgi:hypothetical protein
MGGREFFKKQQETCRVIKTRQVSCFSGARGNYLFSSAFVLSILAYGVVITGHAVAPLVVQTTRPWIIGLTGVLAVM